MCCYVLAKGKTWYKRNVKHRTAKKSATHEHQIVGSGLYAFYFIYLYLCQVTLDVFNCSPIVSLDGVEDAGENGEGYMTSEPTEACYVEGGMQHSLIWPALLGFGVYGIGYPLFVYSLLVFNKENKQLAIEDQVRLGGEARHASRRPPLPNASPHWCFVLPMPLAAPSLHTPHHTARHALATLFRSSARRS